MKKNRSRVPEEKIIVDGNIVYCSSRTSKCRRCKYPYNGDERDVWECPECGEDRRCQMKVKNFGDRCRVHGKKSKRGVDHPNYKDGRHSEYAPYLTPALQRIHEETAAQSRLLELDQEIHLIKDRIKQLMGRLSDGGGESVFRKSLTAFKHLKAMMRSGDGDKTIAALSELEASIKTGLSDYALWNDIDKNLGRLEKMVASERRRIVEAQQIMTLDQGAVMVGIIQATALETFGDHPELLQLYIDRLNTAFQRNKVEVLDG